MFCMECNRLVEKEAGAYIFATGFYRRIYPLGVCTACKCQVERSELFTDIKVIGE